MKAKVFIATSLDGFIARPNGDLDWLPVPESVEGAEDYGYKAFFDGVDAIVMGRNTYEKVLTLGPWSYGTKPVVILSSRDVDIAPELRRTVEHMSGAPAEIAAALGARGVATVYVDGGATIQEFLQAGLVDRLIITRVPVLIGEGIPLFGPVAKDIHLRHISTRAYPTGLVQSEYAVRAVESGT